MNRKTIIAGVSLAGLLAAGAFLAGTIGHRQAHAHSDGHVFAAGEPGDPKKPNRVVEIAMGDGPGTMTFTPDRIEVKVGEQIRFRLKNVGHLAHEFMLDSFENNAKHKIEMEKNPEMEHDDANGKRVDSKKSDEILWRFTKAGTFEFACLIPGHYESGMKGVVVVK
jgi:uncharacterized cupredoxin-like copper-binding protein